MAFDYGSIDLGLKNPFKKEGAVTALRGIVQLALGIYLLIDSVSYVQTSKIAGWIFVFFGAFLLAGGLNALGKGIYAMLRYFVGRNHPTSLAYNFSKSESSTAQEEANTVAYSRQSIEEMLIGRKNSSFVEPIGFLARLLHSFMPKLLFMPYPIRNLMQRLFGAWVKTLIAIVAYAFVAFVSLSGLIGESGNTVFPIYSVALLFYIISVWRKASKPLNRRAELNIESLGTGTIVKVIIWSLLLPVAISIGLEWSLGSSNTSQSKLNTFIAALPALHTYLYLIGVFTISTLGTGLIAVMLTKRLKNTTPTTEVSELRENWQESVHPNEIFINLDNLVMANRRYKEVPNRVYQELDPKLNEQVEGKGDFSGKLIQEIQPRYKPMNLGGSFNISRMVALISGNVLFIIASLFSFLLAYVTFDLYQASQLISASSLEKVTRAAGFNLFIDTLYSAIHLVLIAMIAKSFARLLTTAAHIFFAELQFESLLIYFKCEGTFTESKISTGTGIHDSTRSENTLVRSSITPWVIVSRIVSTTFAATGMRNLEHPRYIQEMHKDDAELASIRADVIGFLKDRESIASITSARDLGNASQIHQLNQQTRAYSDAPQTALTMDEQAAGVLQKEEEPEK
ncbi:hypothetical protein CYL31_01785 [Marinomonas sp. A3A]|uniref:hypothetical protein n=1 Tax=Marinomonas sp. A3A TaxID=2065312 RepID=UPI001BB3CD17|nr:hypothetical protein [Marinomonas sp. A3A]QUX90207.1 hypothetical protein CYL31_01785 [Marinomonas sp. A3A]